MNDRAEMVADGVGRHTWDGQYKEALRMPWISEAMEQRLRQARLGEKPLHSHASREEAS